MQRLKCPVCGVLGVETRADRDLPDGRRFQCERCGRYASTGTALALLFSRMGVDPESVWRLSHQIRLRQAGGQWPLIGSNNLDELLALPPSEAPEQQRRFIRWLADNADANGFVRTPPEARLEAEAICGTGGQDGFGHLLRAAIRDSLATSERAGVVLTTAGWAMAEQKTEPVPATAAAAWALPSWVGRLPDESLQALLDEVYSGLNAGLVMLPMMGDRAAFDRAMDIILGEDKRTFSAKIGAMQSAGRLNARNAEILGHMIDAGSATQHRAWRPNADTVSAVIRELENALWDWFLRDGDAAAVRESTPPRRR